MTTATEEATAKVDLAASNGAAPKRRGRPPGSKNKPKGEATAPRQRRTPAKATAKAATPAAPKTAPGVSNKVHAILVTSDGVEVLRTDGTSEKFSIGLNNAPLFDRR